MEPRALSYFEIISQNLESPKLPIYYYTDSKQSEGFRKGLSAEHVARWRTTCLACAGLWVRLLEHPYPQPIPKSVQLLVAVIQEEKLGD